MEEKDVQMMEVLQRKLESKAMDRQVNIQGAISGIDNDGKLLNDYLVPTEKMNVEYVDGQIFANQINGSNFVVADYAIGQLADKMGVPQKYLKELWTGPEWEKKLAVKIVNEHSSNIDRSRLLIRSVNHEIRGILSDSYRRLNTGTIFTAFMLSVQENNSFIIDAHNGRTRNFLEVIKPKIFPIQTPNNGLIFMSLGAQIRNSDFGHGALSISFVEMQPVCLNGMVTEKILKEVHLGGRLPDDIVLSENTYKKDTETMASLVSDAMRNLFHDDFISERIRKIEKASGIEIDIQREVRELPKLGMRIEEAEKCEKVLMENNPGDGIQGGNTLWKLAQTIGVVARDESDPERSRDLQEIAGKVMMKA